jgi:NADPH2 dehydrogenase
MLPMVCFNWADTDGFETIDRADHYGKCAKGGTGLISIEATAINENGRITYEEMGFWKDEHIPQFKRVAYSCHCFKIVSTSNTNSRYTFNCQFKFE